MREAPFWSRFSDKNDQFTETGSGQTEEKLRNGSFSAGAYVISMAQSASDVLAVRLLQSEAGVQTPMRVVPLFETLDDLTVRRKRSCFPQLLYTNDHSAKTG